MSSLQANQDYEFQLEFDLEEDIEGELEDFVRLARLLAEYAEFVLADKAYQELLQVLPVSKNEDLYSEAEWWLLTLLRDLADGFIRSDSEVKVETAREWYAQLHQPLGQLGDVEIQSLEVYLSILILAALRNSMLPNGNRQFAYHELDQSAWLEFRASALTLLKSGRPWEAHKIVNLILTVSPKNDAKSLLRDALLRLQNDVNEDALIAKVAMTNHYIALRLQDYPRAISDEDLRILIDLSDFSYEQLELLFARSEIRGRYFEDYTYNSRQIEEMSVHKSEIEQKMKDFEEERKRLQEIDKSPLLTRMRGFSSEIVIGLDFGTAYCGVSWAVNRDNKTVRLISNWPNPNAVGSATSAKVPAVISYKNGRVDKWGYNVQSNDESFRWIKILLEPDSKYTNGIEPVKQSDELLTKMGKSAMEVISDYIREIWNFTVDEIRSCQGYDFREVHPLQVVITIPTTWTPAAQEKTRQVASLAGLPDNIAMVTEPEAAVLAILKGVSDSYELHENDCFVVCDAGGSTVDVTSYKILQLEPLRIMEAAIGSCGLCGSVFMDIGFQKWVQTQVGETAYAGLDEASKKEMLRDFECFIKKGFSANSQEEFSIRLRGIDDLSTSLDTTGDEIIVKASVVRTIFDRVCLQIKDLVSTQVDQVRNRGGNIKAIFLVGGFGESRYLLDILKNAYKKDDISLLQVSEGWSSICRGATMWGMERSDLTLTAHKTVKSRLARHNIGLSVNEIWNASIHTEADKYIDAATGTYRAYGQMRWLVKRGDELNEESVIHADLYESVQIGWLDEGVRTFSCPLYYSDDNVPSRRMRVSSVKKLCDVGYDVDCGKIWARTKSYRNTITSRKYRNAHFHLFIQMKSAKLTFLVMFQGETAARVEAMYPGD